MTKISLRFNSASFTRLSSFNDIVSYTTCYVFLIYIIMYNILLLPLSAIVVYMIIYYVLSMTAVKNMSEHHTIKCKGAQTVDKSAGNINHYVPTLKQFHSFTMLFSIPDAVHGSVTRIEI